MPFLKPSVTIFVDKKSAINDIVKCMPRNWPVLNEKSLEIVLDKIKNYTVDFDGIQLAGGSTSTGEIPLIPGFMYTFDTTIALFPQWKENIFDFYMIDKINIKVKDADVTKTKLDYFSRHKAIVRYQIHFDDAQEEIIIGPKYLFNNFFTDVIALSSIISIGTIALSCCLQTFYKGFLKKWKDNIKKREEFQERQRVLKVVKIVQASSKTGILTKE